MRKIEEERKKFKGKEESKDVEFMKEEAME